MTNSLLSARKLCCALFVAIAACLHSASATLMWDARVVEVTPGTGNVVDAKHVLLLPGVVGQVTIAIWAVVTGVDADSTNEGLTSGQYTLMSSPGVFSSGVVVDGNVTGNTALAALGAGTLKGNLSNILNPPWNTASTTKNGRVQDLDGDGDLDVGGLVNGPSVDYIQANAGGLQSSGAPGSFNQLPNGREWKTSIATFDFDTTGALSDGTTGINVVIPQFTTTLNNNARALSVTDGVARTGAAANLAVAAPVIVDLAVPVPEPSMFCLIVVGLVSLVGVRRPVCRS